MEPRAWEMGWPHFPVLQGGPAKLARGSDRNVPDASACTAQADISQLSCYSGHTEPRAWEMGLPHFPSLAGRPRKIRQWLRSRGPEARILKCL